MKLNRNAVFLIFLILVIFGTAEWLIYTPAKTFSGGVAPKKPDFKKSVLPLSGTRDNGNDGALGNCVPDRVTYRYLSWNMKNFGASKSNETIETMANIIAEAKADLVAGQEVSMEYPGPQAVVRLQDALSRKGSKWDSLHSEPTLPRNPSSERYAFWFDAARFDTNFRDAHLMEDLQNDIEREPFVTLFRTKIGNTLRVMQIHAVPTKKGPLNEIMALQNSMEFQQLQGVSTIFSGDFNLSPKDTDVPLSVLGFQSDFRGLTSLKKIPKDGNYLHRQYDNIYAMGKIAVCYTRVVDFTKRFSSPISPDDLRRANVISDHLPVVLGFQFSD